MTPIDQKLFDARADSEERLLRWHGINTNKPHEIHSPQSENHWVLFVWTLTDELFEKYVGGVQLGRHIYDFQMGLFEGTFRYSFGGIPDENGEWMASRLSFSFVLRDKSRWTKSSYIQLLDCKRISRTKKRRRTKIMSFQYKHDLFVSQSSSKKAEDFIRSMAMIAPDIKVDETAKRR